MRTCFLVREIRIEGEDVVRVVLEAEAETIPRDILKIAEGRGAVHIVPTNASAASEAMFEAARDYFHATRKGTSDSAEERELLFSLDSYEAAHGTERRSLAGPPRAAGSSTPDEELVGLWGFIAMALGYNELATRQAKTLGQKVYFRMARDSALLEVERRGGSVPMADPPGEEVLRLEDVGGPPHVVFRERDIELMREAVAAYDAKKGTVRDGS